MVSRLSPLLAKEEEENYLLIDCGCCSRSHSVGVSTLQGPLALSVGRLSKSKVAVVGATLLTEEETTL